MRRKITPLPFFFRSLKVIPAKSAIKKTEYTKLAKEKPSIPATKKITTNDIIKVRIKLAIITDLLKLRLFARVS